MTSKAGGKSDNFAITTDDQWKLELPSLLDGTGSEMNSVYSKCICIWYWYKYELCQVVQKSYWVLLLRVLSILVPIFHIFKIWKIGRRILKTRMPHFLSYQLIIMLMVKTMPKNRAYSQLKRIYYRNKFIGNTNSLMILTLRVNFRQFFILAQMS